MKATWHGVLHDYEQLLPGTLYKVRRGIVVVAVVSHIQRIIGRQLEKNYRRDRR